MDLKTYLDRQTQKINRALLTFLPKESERPAALSRAMRYAVLSGGKRIRPIFVLAACEAVGGKETRVMDAACALELIHSYSLVHDDLPCMDDDETRRGKPSCHVKFGEAIALLAGDALLTKAFHILSRSVPGKDLPGDHKRLQALHWISQAIGSQGMVGGQTLDMQYQGKEMDLPTVEYINTHKSGALIAVSVQVGAALGGGSPKQVEALTRYGKCIGLLFQIVDDIMDAQGYAEVIGPREALEEAGRLLAKAKREISFFGKKAELLGQIADFVAARKD